MLRAPGAAGVTAGLASSSRVRRRAGRQAPGASHRRGQGRRPPLRRPRTAPAAATRENGGGPGGSRRASPSRAGPGRGVTHGVGPGRGAPSPRRRRPRPPPPPPRAARSVPAARLGRSGPPLSSARSCSGRRAPAAAAVAARADGGPGVPAAAAALLRSVRLRLWLGGPALPPPLRSPPPSRGH